MKGSQPIVDSKQVRDFSEGNIKGKHTETYYEYIQNMLIQNGKVEESMIKMIKQQEEKMSKENEEEMGFGLFD